MFCSCYSITWGILFVNSFLVKKAGGRTRPPCMFTFVSRVIPTETNVVSGMECIPRNKSHIFMTWDTLDCAYGFARYDTVDGKFGLYNKTRAVARDRPPYMFTFVLHVIPTETNVVSEMECIPRNKSRFL